MSFGSLSLPPRLSQSCLKLGLDMRLILLAAVLGLANTYDSTMVNRLMEQKHNLIQDGLSFFNGTSIDRLREMESVHGVRVLIVVENWTKWLLGFPEYYADYGQLKPRFHVREVFSAHREIVLAVSEKDALTGAAGIASWSIGEQGRNLLLMWAVPYNQLMYNAYFALGVTSLSSRDVLPYWYHRMYAGQGDVFVREAAGHKVVFKGEEVFIMGQMSGDAYQPLLNVSVMPWSTANLAPSVWHQLYLKSNKEAQQRFSKGSRQKQQFKPIILSVILTNFVFKNIFLY